MSVGLGIQNAKLKKQVAALTADRDELLDALKEVVRISDRKHDAWDKAKAAIAKAEGRKT